MENNNSLMEEEKTEAVTEAGSAQDDSSAKKKRPDRAERKQAKRERKARWKEKKKTRRADLKSFYSDAPWIVRFSRLYLPRILAVVLAVGVCVALAVCAKQYIPLLRSISVVNVRETADPEKIYSQSPIDEEGAAAVEALPTGNPDDSWAVYVYMVGSDLEDYDYSSLSDLAKASSKKIREEQSQLSAEKYDLLLENYLDVLDKNGLEPPMFLYEAKENVETTANPNSAEAKAFLYQLRSGAASNDIKEMIKGAKSDKVKVILQTGGARQWSFQYVNPNRTQRFVISGDDITEEESMPLKRASDPETFKDFLRYCKEKHPAEHTILVLWNHGSGAFGYGHDSIFGGNLSIAEVRNALNEVYTPDMDSPPFDIIGYDACLMASIEVLHSLEGFAEYYVVSEETEPADGWDYTSWLTQLSEHPEMNPAQAARAIVDSYTDFYMNQNVTYENTIWNQNNVTMSLINAKKGAELYSAYCSLAKKQLIDSVDDISVLAEIGRASGSSTCYSGTYYNVQNTIDLGNYLSNMKDRYPGECEELTRLLEETVVYHRENGSLADSTGVALYVPSFINSYTGTLRMLEYVFNVCEDESIKALYFYKTAGCLTDEMKAYVRSLTDHEPQTLNTKLFDDFSKADPVIDGNKFTVPVASEIKNMITAKFILQIAVNMEEGNIVYYGTDELAETDSEGNITSGQYDGSWIFLDDQPLSPEIVSSSASAVEYRAKVLKDGVPVFLLFSCDRKTGEYTIKGTKPYTEEDSENLFINVKVNCESIADSKIVPIYEAVKSVSEDIYEIEGKPVKCTENTAITRKPLDDGSYAVAAVIADQRGDWYLSEMLVCEVSDGKASAFIKSDDFVENVNKDTDEEK